MMKSIRALFILGVAALPFSSGFSQAAATLVYDQAEYNLQSQNQTEMINLMNQQLQQAQQIYSTVTKQLTQLGNSSTLTLNGMTAASNDVQSVTNSQQAATPTTSLATNQQLTTMNTSITGQEVFNTSVDGLFTPIGSTVTLSDGTQVQRDPSKYKIMAALQTRIQEYYRVRDQAQQRQQALLQYQADTYTALQQATDQATVEKLTAQMQAIQGRLTACDEEIKHAADDVTMLEKQITTEARVVMQGKSEINSNSNGIPSSVQQRLTPGAMSNNANMLTPNVRPTGVLPWGSNSFQFQPSSSSGN